MAAPSTRTAIAAVSEPVSVTEIPAPVQKSREQLVSSLQQGRQLSIDAADGWAKALSAFPVLDLTTIPGLPVLPDEAAVTRFIFDVASDLLDAQRAFAVELAKVLMPATTA